ncbi:hypothetical protein V8E51_008806 [Hyaloscypha variabilis]
MSKITSSYALIDRGIAQEGSDLCTNDIILRLSTVVGKVTQCKYSKVLNYRKCGHVGDSKSVAISSGANGGRLLSKEFWLGMAQQRNKAPLPRVLRNEWGVRLPSERFVLTGLPWGLKSEWEVDEKEAIKGDGMEGVEMEEQGWEGGEEGATMEDLFSGDPDPDIDKMIERKKGIP